MIYEMLKKALIYGLGATDEHWEMENWPAILLEKLIAIFIIILIGYISINIVNRALAKVTGSTTRKVTYTLKPHVNVLMKAFFAVIVISIIFSILGIKLVEFLQIFATFGIALGFALQASFSNLVSGILIRHFKDINEGDVVLLVDSGGREIKGKIKVIKLEKTVLVNIEGKELIVPNNILASNIITKLNTGEEKEKTVIKEG